MDPEFQRQFQKSFRNFKIAYWTSFVLWVLILLSLLTTGVLLLLRCL